MFDTSPQGILELVVKGENPYVEFKTHFTVDRMIARHLTAFANSGGGILIIGVGENGELNGLGEEEADAALHRLEKLGSALFPPELYRAGKVAVDGKLLVYVTVDEAPEFLRPVRVSSGDAYIRDGATTKLLPDARTARAVSASEVPGTLFVVMSFREEEEPALVDYYSAIVRAAKRVNSSIQVRRMNQIEGDYEISQQIMEEIDGADIVLADFTLSPANVYFEAGYARGRGRRIMQTARKGTVLQFDVRNWHTTFYKNGTELEEVLVSGLEQAYTQVLEARRR